MAVDQDVPRRMLGETVCRWDDVVFLQEYTLGNCDLVRRDLGVRGLYTSIIRYPPHARVALIFKYVCVLNIKNSTCY